MQKLLKELHLMAWQIIGGWGLDLYMAAEKRGAWSVETTEADLERWERRGWIKERSRYPKSDDGELPF